MAKSPRLLKFQHHSEVCAYYGVTEACLRAWKALGRGKGDPFPQEHPVEVLRWYRRHHTKGIPTRLLVAAKRFSGMDFPLMGR